MIYDLKLIIDKKCDTEKMWFSSIHTPDSWKVTSKRHKLIMEAQAKVLEKIQQEEDKKLFEKLKM